MSLRYALIVVEGPHDRAFVGRVLSGLGFSSFKDKPNKGRKTRLDAFWNEWVPSYPKSDNLYMPLDMLDIWENTDWAVGVKAAGGSEIFSTFPKTQLVNKPEWLAKLTTSNGAIAIVADADQAPVDDTFKKLEQAYNPVLGGFPTTAGSTVALPLRIGAYVLPDCVKEGTVESVLLPLGQTNHGKLLQHAQKFVDGCEPELKADFKPFDHLKATVAAAASILQPGSTNTVTIEKDQWITTALLDHPELTPFVTFLRNLLELPNVPKEPSPTPTAANTGQAVGTGTASP
jgi:hypothetical protein